MCIFFISPQCPAFYYNQWGDHQDELIARHIQGALTNSETTRIGRCFIPTGDNPFACCNPKLRLQVRHQSDEYDDCEECTAFARVWQAKLLKGAVDLVDEDDKPMTKEEGLAALGKLAETKMVRRNDQFVKKNDCLCDVAAREGHDHIHGNKMCGEFEGDNTNGEKLVNGPKYTNDNTYLSGNAHLNGDLDGNKHTNGINKVVNGDKFHGIQKEQSAKFSW
jgi:hypothetical protein